MIFIDVKERVKELIKTDTLFISINDVFILIVDIILYNILKYYINTFMNKYYSE